MIRKYIIYVPTCNMYNGKQGEQLLKKGGHSASLDRKSKMQRAKCTAKLNSGGHKVMQHGTHNKNKLDKCEPQQQYRLGTVSYK